MPLTSMNKKIHIYIFFYTYNFYYFLFIFLGWAEPASPARSLACLPKPSFSPSFPHVMGFLLFPVAFSGFYKPRGWPLFRCSCLTIARHERLCFLEKKQGQKICSLLSFFFFVCSSQFFFFSSRSPSLSLFFLLFLWLL